MPIGGGFSGGNGCGDTRGACPHPKEPVAVHGYCLNDKPVLVVVANDCCEKVKPLGYITIEDGRYHEGALPEGLTQCKQEIKLDGVEIKVDDIKIDTTGIEKAIREAMRDITVKVDNSDIIKALRDLKVNVTVDQSAVIRKLDELIGKIGNQKVEIDTKALIDALKNIRVQIDAEAFRKALEDLKIKVDASDIAAEIKKALADLKITVDNRDIIAKLDDLIKKIGDINATIDVAELRKALEGLRINVGARPIIMKLNEILKALEDLKVNVEVDNSDVIAALKDLKVRIDPTDNTVKLDAKTLEALCKCLEDVKVDIDAEAIAKAIQDALKNVTVKLDQTDPIKVEFDPEKLKVAFEDVTVKLDPDARVKLDDTDPIKVTIDGTEITVKLDPDQKVKIEGGPITVEGIEDIKAALEDLKVTIDPEALEAAFKAALADATIKLDPNTTVKLDPDARVKIDDTDPIKVETEVKLPDDLTVKLDPDASVKVTGGPIEVTGIEDIVAKLEDLNVTIDPAKLKEALADITVKVEGGPIEVDGEKLKAALDNLKVEFDPEALKAAFEGVKIKAELDPAEVTAKLDPEHNTVKIDLEHGPIPVEIEGLESGIEIDPGIRCQTVEMHDGSCTEFLRTICRDKDGEVVQAVDTTLDGKTAYTPKNAAGGTGDDATACVTLGPSNECVCEESGESWGEYDDGYGIDCEPLLLCDANGEFLRTVCYDEATGRETSRTDTTLAGEPYTATGEVKSCGGKVTIDGDDLKVTAKLDPEDLKALTQCCPTINTQVLCDDNGEFFRHVTITPPDNATTIRDTDINGQAYTPVGKIGVCGGGVKPDPDCPVTTWESCKDTRPDGSWTIYSKSTLTPCPPNENDKVITETYGGEPYTPTGDVVCTPVGKEEAGKEEARKREDEGKGEECTPGEEFFSCTDTDPTKVVHLNKHPMLPDSIAGWQHVTLDNGVKLSVLGGWPNGISRTDIRAEYGFGIDAEKRTLEFKFDKPVYFQAGLTDVEANEWCVLPETMTVTELNEAHHEWDPVKRHVTAKNQQGNRRDVLTEQTLAVSTIATTEPVTSLVLRTEPFEGDRYDDNLLTDIVITPADATVVYTKTVTTTCDADNKPVVTETLTRCGEPYVPTDKNAPCRKVATIEEAHAAENCDKPDPTVKWESCTELTDTYRRVYSKKTVTDPDGKVVSVETFFDGKPYTPTGDDIKCVPVGEGEKGQEEARKREEYEEFGEEETVTTVDECTYTFTTEDWVPIDVTKLPETKLDTPGSGKLPSGIGYSFAGGKAQSADDGEVPGYLFSKINTAHYPDGQKWTFDRPLKVRFGVNNLQAFKALIILPIGTQESVHIPEGFSPETVHKDHVWHADKRLIAQKTDLIDGRGGQGSESTFVSDGKVTEFTVEDKTDKGILGRLGMTQFASVAVSRVEVLDETTKRIKVTRTTVTKKNSGELVSMTIVDSEGNTYDPDSGELDCSGNQPGPCPEVKKLPVCDYFTGVDKLLFNGTDNRVTITGTAPVAVAKVKVKPDSRGAFFFDASDAYQVTISAGGKVINQMTRNKQPERVPFMLTFKVPEGVTEIEIKMEDRAEGNRDLTFWPLRVENAYAEKTEIFQLKETDCEGVTRDIGYQLRDGKTAYELKGHLSQCDVPLPVPDCPSFTEQTCTETVSGQPVKFTRWTLHDCDGNIVERYERDGVDYKPVTGREAWVCSSESECEEGKRNITEHCEFVTTESVTHKIDLSKLAPSPKGDPVKVTLPSGVVCTIEGGKWVDTPAPGYAFSTHNSGFFGADLKVTFSEPVMCNIGINNLDPVEDLDSMELVWLADEKVEIPAGFKPDAVNSKTGPGQLSQLHELEEIDGKTVLSLNGQGGGTNDNANAESTFGTIERITQFTLTDVTTISQQNSGAEERTFVALSRLEVKGRGNEEVVKNVTVIRIEDCETGVEIDGSPFIIDENGRPIDGSTGKLRNCSRESSEEGD